MDGIKSMGENFESNKENHGSNKRVFKKNQIKVTLPLFNNREYVVLHGPAYKLRRNVL